MFQQRLIAFSIFLIGLLTLLISRLFILQIHHGSDYAGRAQQLLLRSPEWLDTVRGSITDRHGRILAEDRLGFRVALHYKLLRLYDERFWRYFELKYLHDHDASTPDHVDVAQYLQDKYNLKHPPAEQEIPGLAQTLGFSLDRVHAAIIQRNVERYLQKQFGSQRQLADQYLVEMAAICDFSMDDVHAAIKQLNDEIFAIRSLVTLKKYLQQNDLPPLDRNARQSTIMQNLRDYFPDEYHRLSLVYHTAIMEMDMPHPILDTLSRETALTIEDRFVGSFLSRRSYDRPITVTHGKMRIYPYNDVACHLIGQLGPVAPEQKPQDRKPTPHELNACYFGDRSGDWGAEHLFENRLRGSRGWVRHNRKNEVLDEIQRRLGQNVSLTIDIRLQMAIQHLLAGQNERNRPFNGGAVVIDVPSGEILAAVSTPTFDLNTYYQRDQFNFINEIGVEDPCDRWINRSFETHRNYQTGSTIKPTNLLGGLTLGTVNENTSMYCSHSGRPWTGFPKDIHDDGPTNARKAIKVSCNYYFVMLAIQMGGENLSAWLREAGFGRRILAWPDDITANRAWRAFRESPGHISPIGNEFPRLPIDIRLMGIGRGLLDASVLQMANSAATIARDGIFLEPVLFTEPPIERRPRRLAAADHVQTVREGMWAVVNESHYGPDGTWDRGGTAYSAFHPLPWPENDVTVYGKTGSTENSLFICFAEGRPGQSLAVAVLIEAEEHGSELAAPFARDILKTCSALNYLPALKPPKESDDME